MMTIAFVCAVAQGAWAENVTFNVRSWNGTAVESSQVTKEGFQVLEGSHADDWIGLDGNYVVKGDVSYKVLNITGERVLLVLADNSTLNCNHIKLEPGHSLHIYSQSDSDNQGKLIVKNYEDDEPVYKYAAAIGGGENADMGSLYVHGGYINARTHTYEDLSDASAYGAGIGGGNGHSIAGEVIIYGGKVRAHGCKYGAGIGGGDSGNQGGQVVIYGGEVNADSQKYGAGIGGGDGTSEKGNGGIIKIYGGKVQANGGYSKSGSGNAAAGGAGLGGGRQGRAGEVYIYGGEVDAIGGKDAAGIGGSRNYGGGKCEISGGSVFARGGVECASFIFSYSAPAIGGGRIKGPGSNVSITGGTVMLVKMGTGSSWCPLIGGGYESGDYGKLHIGAGMKVSWSKKDDWDLESFMDATRDTEVSPLTLVDNSSTRGAYCTSRGYTYVKIEPCKHEESFTYTIIDNSYHNKVCKFCGLSTTEDHIDENCSLCGLGQSTKKISFYVPDTEAGSGYRMLKEYEVAVSKEFPLPECPTGPEGYTFKGWEMNPETVGNYMAVVGTDLQDPGTELTLSGFSGNATFYARFLYDLIDSWTWEEDGSSFVVTLTHPQTNFSAEVHYDANHPKETSITSEEEVDDDGNVYGTLFTGHVNWTDPQTGYEYRFIGLQHVQNFDDGQATAISTFPSGAWGADDQATIYYTLDGRRLAGKPTTRGLYIRTTADGGSHGKKAMKVVIK